MNNIISGIYDSLIVDMTEKWYRAVLAKLEDGSTVLDVGVGTAGALLRCSDLVESKNLKIIGIDYNEFYIQSAKGSIKKANMSDRISVHELDLYNEEKVQALLKEKSVDTVYFSGSFSLLPDPDGALKSILPLLKKDGKAYITQTYQKRSPPLFGSVKPLIKYLTTIDFGRLISVEEIVDFLNDNKDFDLESHNVIEGSVDTYFQAAYLSILKQQNGKDI
jgi:ubiquinone/menaquinone biosynthesis C-methylase UbiE